MQSVSVKQVPTYSPQLLDEAVAAHFNALDVAGDLTPDSRVLIKPNLLAGRAPDLAVTTHPELLLAVVRWLLAHGITKITLADSPGGAYTPASLRRTYTACGLDVLDDFLTLNEDTTASSKDGFSIITPVLEADYIINCCKLKTHGLTVMTAGVKNLFGCIPGLKKPEIHCMKPTIGSFCNLLVDLAEVVRPQVTLLDAIDCMEGNGPGGGSVRHMGYTLASRSPYALDEQATLLMGLQVQMIPILRIAKERKLLSGATQLLGDALEPANPPFKLPDAVLGTESIFTPKGIFHVVFGRKKAFPRVLTRRCVGCGLCAESCPKHIIKIVNKKAVIPRKNCISCFCCQEMCPAHAIEAK